ncbi:PaaI family thioesterase [Porphyromonas pogonae]|uniref:PaaI family thioesterase n=1 Tax=Porphyromonas pogonae TaxID=867595 RepID=UPI002E75E3C2|nr:PaaI family thioesterase [Porphyromonas pogonae]
MKIKAFQEYYSAHNSHCFGCGYSNEHGLHLLTYWLDEAAGTTISRYTPPSFATGGVPGFAYGGLIAALMDCHGNATAFATGHKHYGVEPSEDSGIRYVTASITVDYLRPTPIDRELVITGKAVEITDRKVKMEMKIGFGDDEVTAKATMVAVRLKK